MQVGNDKVKKLALGGETFVNQNDGWLTRTDNDPSGILTTNNFVYKVNRDEKYVSIFMTGETISDAAYYKNTEFFDLSWLVSGIESIDMSLPQLAYPAEPAIIGNTIVSTSTHLSTEGVIAHFTSKFNLICAPLHYSEPRVYYSRLVEK